MKKKILTIALAALTLVAGIAAYDAQDEVWAQDVYDIKMHIYVPRIYDNNQSLGYRKYQSQSVQGEMLMQYNVYGQLIDVKFTNMVNRTHKMANGKNVTYNAFLDYDKQWPKFNAIGSNKTLKFKTASICFAMAAEPSYNIGEFDEDNALYIMCAGKGTFHSKDKVLKYATGYLAGTLGCGCMAYGHTSPTRKIGYFGPIEDQVDDVAAVYGRWTVRYKPR